VRADAEQTRTLTRVETLVAAATAQPPAPVPNDCAYQAGDKTRIGAAGKPLTGPGVPGALPQGVYRYAQTHDELVAASMNEEDADLNAGIFTYTLQNGSWSYRHQPADTAQAVNDCSGWYTISGNAAAFTTATMVVGGDCTPPTWTARWAAEGAQLTWSDVNEPDFAFIWAGKGGRRSAETLTIFQARDPQRSPRSSDLGDHPQRCSTSTAMILPCSRPTAQGSSRCSGRIGCGEDLP
jgi:hypothetical protein